MQAEPLIQDAATALQAAKDHLTNGKWRRAEQICREILERDNDAQAAFLLGQVYVASGVGTSAIEWFRKAVNWSPETAEHHFSLAGALETKEAMEEAAGAWLAGIQIDPSYLPAHLSLSRTLLSLGLHEASATAARHALLVDSECAEAYELWGRAAELAGSRGEAAEAFRKSIELRPHGIESLRRLAAIHRQEGNSALACDLLRQAVERKPRDAGIRFEYALSLSGHDVRQQAIEQLREALRLKPHFPEAYSNLGLLYRAERRFAEAETSYKKACAQNPRFAMAWNNLGNLYTELVRLEDAERSYSKAIAADPDYADAHTTRAMLRLLTGRFKEGWQEYEWRWRRSKNAPRTFARPEWDGASLHGRTILLHAEQGAGDTIQFIRYARILRQQGARVVLHCPASLRSLLAGMPELSAVCAGDDTVPEFDVHAPLMSLPRILGTIEETIPGEIPYLQVPPDAVVPEVLRDAEGFRVGLVWAGNPNHQNDRNRSVPPGLFATLASVENARFFSLQVGAETAQNLPPELEAVDLAPHLAAYADTAACLSALDLLITVDTSVAHLAGALGRPVWVLLPACNDWRWMLKRPDSPWYPTMRIFRQQKLGEWKSVLEEIAGQCRLVVGQSHTPATRR